MINDPNFLLGTAFALLTQARAHMIRKDDLYGIELIESQYQELQDAIESIYYTEKKDVK